MSAKGGLGEETGGACNVAFRRILRGTFFCWCAPSRKVASATIGRLSAQAFLAEGAPALLAAATTR